MRLQLGGWVAVAFALGGCTEPNPFAQMDSEEGTTEGPTSASSASTASASTSSASTSMDPTSSTSTAATDETTDATTTEDPSTSTGEPVCPGGHTCVPEPPKGWTGPVVVSVDALGLEPACEGDFPEASLAAFADLVAPDATCECACEDPFDLSCGFPTLRYYTSGTTCAGAASNSWVINSACESISGAGGEYWEIDAPAVTGGECDPVVVEASVSPPEWTTAITSCTNTFDAAGCDVGSLCMRMPSAPFQPLACIWMQGDVACPEGDYTERSVYYTDFSDTRGCGTCGCGDAEGTCEGNVRTFQDQTCTSPVNTFTADGVCRQGGALGVGSAEWEWADDDVIASCDPVGGAPEGLAAPTGPYTFCCLAE